MHLEIAGLSCNFAEIKKDKWLNLLILLRKISNH
jgi:hypothetical protein